ncbi:DUF262 domain-containing protein [Clostridium botulinum]|uniref:DUF262 domain-containing protein n=1 Tax=Clostridium botulinum TaxID=1491 RepID=UPI001A9317C5|nr:DUF262 domain-containing protein [Clostridium botulinum]MBO0526479.1 DUF262 domain-containing protein [Clostridium botulinum]MBO0527743.1 DUF262 domain-containing protein [Clostridium botulinum]MBO0531329.1 DUF262 domain-containing protein [Clostridium botulinum]MBO0535734.1 DUF262 domain-containing protein [Clostridium botulinum]MBO0537834.1 DUF262 domain-containing protein [Clostridium botulinum]
MRERDKKEEYGIDSRNPELEGEESLDPEKELSSIYSLENIKIDPGYFSVFELKRKYDRTKTKKRESTEYTKADKRNQIILDSDFQREKVWNRKQQSELIESVLMGLPIPIMYLSEDKFGNLIVVDGRQRLTAFFEFLDNKFELTELKILNKLSNKKFDEIEPIYQSKIEDYQLITQIIKPPTPDTVKFHVFDRVNRGGTPLNNQEMRNALYQGNSTKLLERLSKDELFKTATANGLKPKRMKDKYIILRSIAFYLWVQNLLTDDQGKLIKYEGDIDDFLGKTMEYLNFVEESILINLEGKFKVAMRNANRILGEDAFRLTRNESGNKSPINMNVFEVLVYIMITLGDNRNLDAIIKEKYSILINDKEFLDNIANHRDAMNKVEDRFKKISEEFIEVIIGD